MPIPCSRAGGLASPRQLFLSKGFFSPALTRLWSRRASLRARLCWTSPERLVWTGTLQCHGLGMGWKCSAPVLGSLEAPATREDGRWCWSSAVSWQRGFE